MHNIPFQKTIEQVECGLDTTFLVTSDGEVYSCGLSADGQTGAVTFIFSFTTVVHVCFMRFGV